MNSAAAYPPQRAGRPRASTASLPASALYPADASRWVELSLVPAAAGVWLHVLVGLGAHL